MITVQDVCITQLLSKGITSLHHNQTICRVSDKGYHALLKCVILDNPINQVDYYEYDGEYPTLVILFSKINSDHVIQETYLYNVPNTLQEVESIVKQTFELDMALRVR